MEKVRPWCGKRSGRGRLKNRTEHYSIDRVRFHYGFCGELSQLRYSGYKVKSKMLSSRRPGKNSKLRFNRDPRG